jgi:hypothetical protein
MARRGMACGREDAGVSVWVCCDGSGHIVAGAGEAAALSQSLVSGSRSGNRRRTQAAAGRGDRLRVRLVASRSGGASKRLTDGAEEGTRRARARGRRGRWWWWWWEGAAAEWCVYRGGVCRQRAGRK